jgi:hypothetical protein
LYDTGIRFASAVVNAFILAGMVGPLIAAVRVAVQPVDDDRAVDRLRFVRRSPLARRKLQGRPGRPCSEMFRPVIVLLWKVTSSHC